ncbi:toll/interleukin-1 receptor domain-containing protein [Nodosilinea sp. LEGE 07298]|uniref:toll/interleukin-1 receptor domain-containing protein n=1 Tax=Nodosilinea sp. LEGE 07298 TaxID=2777970 RepID=UPI00188286A3|nr:toll/interleukin-1 receptor domain-containing protein [Nodosilinea sp. LEGE 07298]MBE9111622.1 toll/interleukin-1 receptor domain-containing protein [Nodosilinea sp. LEGE 07298]
MPTIFLSYARKDGQAAVTRLKAELEQAGFQVWRDIEGMRGGRAWRHQILDVIYSADAVVLVLTPSAVNSENVNWEWESAKKQDKTVIPVQVMTFDLPSNLKELHCHKLINEQTYTLGFASLIRDLFATSGSPDDQLEKLFEDRPFKPLEINLDQLEIVNSDLSFVESLQQKGYLDESQGAKFARIKQEVHSLNKFNPKLDHLHDESKALLAGARSSLAKKVEELKRNSEQTLDSENLLKLSQEKDCKEGELRILQNFMDELEDSSLVAAWINHRAKTLAKKIGREALESFPKIGHDLSDEDVGYFCFSIYQFLEQISHCLRWGRYDILDSPGIPLVLDRSVYEKAFSLIKECIENDLPKRFNQAGKRLAVEYIDYLMGSLKTYETYE